MPVVMWASPDSQAQRVCPDKAAEAEGERAEELRYAPGAFQAQEQAAGAAARADAEAKVDWEDKQAGQASES